MTDCTNPETGTHRQPPPGWARRLLGYCLRHRTDLLLAFGAAVVAAVATATLPLVLRHVVDGVAAGDYRLARPVDGPPRRHRRGPLRGELHPALPLR